METDFDLLSRIEEIGGSTTYEDLINQIHKDEETTGVDLIDFPYQDFFDTAVNNGHLHKVDNLYLITEEGRKYLTNFRREEDTLFANF